MRVRGDRSRRLRAEGRLTRLLLSMHLSRAEPRRESFAIAWGGALAAAILRALLVAQCDTALARSHDEEIRPLQCLSFQMRACRRRLLCAACWQRRGS